jgi:tetratricopeptide (TPR) repeat protein
MKRPVLLALSALLTVATLTLPARAQQYNLFYGDNMKSRYSITKDNGLRQLSPTIFDRYGKARREPGQLMIGRLHNPQSGQTGTAQTNTNGYVWTPRALHIDDMDMSESGKISHLPDFNLESFVKHPAVIEFTNGYAVNLYGAEVANYEIISPGKEGTYLTNTDRPLPARLISVAIKPSLPLVVGERVVAVESCEIRSGNDVLGTITPGTSLPVLETQQPWIRTVVRQSEKDVTGWVASGNLRRIEERVWGSSSNPNTRVNRVREPAERMAPRPADELADLEPEKMAPADDAVPEAAPPQAQLTCIEGICNRGCALLDEGNLEKAAKRFGKALELDPDCATAHWGCGEANRLQGQCEGAVGHYTTALRLDPGLVSAYGGRASCYLELAELDKAQEDLEHALRLDSSYGFGYWCRGILWANKNDLTKAIADLDSAIQCGFEQRDAYALRGELRYELGQYELARADFDQAIRIGPECVDARTYLAEILLRQGNLAKASAELSRALQLDSDYLDAIAARGLMHQLQGKPEDAIADWSRIIQDDPQSAVALVARALNHVQTGNVQQARKDLVLARAADSQCLQRYKKYVGDLPINVDGLVGKIAAGAK